MRVLQVPRSTAISFAGRRLPHFHLENIRATAPERKLLAIVMAGLHFHKPPELSSSHEPRRSRTRLLPARLVRECSLALTRPREHSKLPSGLPAFPATPETARIPG